MKGNAIFPEKFSFPIFFPYEFFFFVLITLSSLFCRSLFFNLKKYSLFYFSSFKRTELLLKTLYLPLFELPSPYFPFFSNYPPLKISLYQIFLHLNFLSFEFSSPSKYFFTSFDLNPSLLNFPSLARSLTTFSCLQISLYFHSSLSFSLFLFPPT